MVRTEAPLKMSSSVVRFGRALLLTLLITLVSCPFVVLGPRLKVGRTISWRGVTLAVPKLVVCCPDLHGFNLFCAPVGSSLWSFPENFELMMISSWEEPAAQSPSSIWDELLDMGEPRQGVKVIRTKSFEEGPGSDADREPQRVWRRQVFERSADHLVMAVDSIAVRGATFSATIHAMLSPPWGEAELVQMIRSVRKDAKP